MELFSCDKLFLIVYFILENLMLVYDNLEVLEYVTIYLQYTEKSTSLCSKGQLALDEIMHN